MTYLFEGEILHRDSLGSVQAIRPGDVNWMTAGRGIAHSERTPPSGAPAGQRLHGLQCWVALPAGARGDRAELPAPPGGDPPTVRRPGARLACMVGAAFGADPRRRGVADPVCHVRWRRAPAAVGATTRTGRSTWSRARSAATGAGSPAGTMVVLRPAVPAAIEAEGRDARDVPGRRPLAGERHIWWNFVSSSRARIERAKDDWRRALPRVPGDEVDFIPLPDA